MKTLHELRTEQQSEVNYYRSIAQKAVQQLVVPQQALIGALLAGSVARGDARKGPFGLYIDLVVVAEDRQDVNLTEIFGPNIEPYIPKHCIKYEEAGLAIELTTREDLLNIRSMYESIIFARQESIVLNDKTGFLQKWKDSAFQITAEQARDRALPQFFRCDYLVGDYRLEKWKYRKAWVQLGQIGNEAVECYCNFLYCINGLFIPRKDWLVYLTYDLQDKMPDHEHVLDNIYTVAPTESGVDNRFHILSDVLSWIRNYCSEKGWIS